MVPNSGDAGDDGGDEEEGEEGDAGGDDEPSIRCSLKSVLGTGIPP